MRLGLIGNCRYQALIDDRAAVRWLCWPRFDDSFVFGSLIDEDRGGVFTVEPAEGDSDTEQHYLRNTNILVTTFRQGDAVFEVVDFAPRFRLYERYYKPTMLVRIIRRLAGSPSLRVRCRPVYRYGELEPRRHIASNHIQWEVPEGALRLTTNVPQSYIDEGRPFLLEQDAYVVLTWGEPLEASLEETCESFLTRTRAYWERWVKHTALPGCFSREVIRSALTLKMHQYEETGAITAATTTSLPEYPGSGRNWDYRYCWLRDAYFTLNAMRRLNHFEESEGFVSYLLNLAGAFSSKLQPCYGISGEAILTERVLDHLAGYQGSGPVRIGNAAYRQVQNDVYGEMMAAIAPTFLDVRFEDAGTVGTERLVRQLLDRIADTMEVPDAGLWEIRDEPKLHTFSLLMHWLGARVAGDIGNALGDADLEGRGRGLALRAASIIEERCWREAEGFYADATSSNNADAALLMMINLGFLRPGQPKAESHLRALAERLTANDTLLYRYRHHDGLGDTHSTFTVCGFWYVEALARLGHREEARASLAKLIGHANHLGLYSEDIDPADGRLWGNFPQTYSHVGLINAAFAIDPLPPQLF